MLKYYLVEKRLVEPHIQGERVFYSEQTNGQFQFLIHEPRHMSKMLHKHNGGEWHVARTVMLATSKSFDSSMSVRMAAESPGQYGRSSSRAWRKGRSGIETSQFWRLETDVTLISKAEGTVSMSSERTGTAHPPAEAWGGANFTEEL
jgi:hypothetical protein